MLVAFVLIVMQPQVDSGPPVERSPVRIACDKYLTLRLTTGDDGSARAKAIQVSRSAIAKMEVVAKQPGTSLESRIRVAGAYADLAEFVAQTARRDSASGLFVKAVEAIARHEDGNGVAQLTRCDILIRWAAHASKREVNSRIGRARQACDDFADRFLGSATFGHLALLLLGRCSLVMYQRLGDLEHGLVAMDYFEAVTKHLENEEGAKRSDDLSDAYFWHLRTLRLLITTHRRCSKSQRDTAQSELWAKKTVSTFWKLTAVRSSHRSWVSAAPDAAEALAAVGKRELAQTILERAAMSSESALETARVRGALKKLAGSRK